MSRLVISTWFRFSIVEAMSGVGSQLASNYWNECKWSLVQARLRRTKLAILFLSLRKRLSEFAKAKYGERGEEQPRRP